MNISRFHILHVILAALSCTRALYIILYILPYILYILYYRVINCAIIHIIQRFKFQQIINTFMSFSLLIRVQFLLENESNIEK